MLRDLALRRLDQTTTKDLVALGDVERSLLFRNAGLSSAGASGLSEDSFVWSFQFSSSGDEEGDQDNRDEWEEDENDEGEDEEEIEDGGEDAAWLMTDWIWK